MYSCVSKSSTYQLKKPMSHQSLLICQEQNTFLLCEPCQLVIEVVRWIISIATLGGIITTPVKGRDSTDV